MITDVRIENTGAARTSAPFTFGQVFKPGDLQPGDGLTGKLSSVTVLALQCNVKATHADGSVRHAVISGLLPAIAAGEVQMVQLEKARQPAGAAPSLQKVDAAVALVIAGAKYTASVSGAAKALTWRVGSIANETIFDAPLLDGAGAAHPRLTARFGVRWVGDKIRVETIIENTKTFTAASNETYDVEIQVAGRTTYSAKGLTHYHHARWRRVDWLDGQPDLIVHPNTAYLIATRAVSNYDQSIAFPESVIADYFKQITPSTAGPMKIGTAATDMGATGGRPDIGPLPQWVVLYLLTGDKRARAIMGANAEGSGTWPIHYREEGTGYPLRTDNEANSRVSLHPNMAGRGPLPVPRYLNNDAALGAVPYAPDNAHQPSLAYVPYLLTGEYYYLEELHFWAAWNPLGTDSGYSGNGAGLLRWQQVRGQAWSMRTLGHAVYITPDAHPMKAYFAKQLDNNFEFYTTTYVKGNPNLLGVYDGSGEGAFEVSKSAPWQDDFFTWSFGYLAELGFDKARSIFEWKAKYPVGRMTAPGYCWIDAAAYSLDMRTASGGPILKTFAELYDRNFAEDQIVDDNGRKLAHPQGLKYRDQSCGSKAQADWRAAATGGRWPEGRMTGYADSALGYPANMQPALAMAASLGVENGARAWSVFVGRADQPDYSKGPQWAIVPRVPDAVVVPSPVPVPTPAPTKPAKITTPSSTKLAKLKGLTVGVFDPVTLKPIKTFAGVTASTKGVVVVADSALVKAIQYAATVKNAAGTVVLVFYPLTAV